MESRPLHVKLSPGSDYILLSTLRQKNQRNYTLDSVAYSNALRSKSLIMVAYSEVIQGAGTRRDKC